jgi:hypothetical protein
VLKNDNLQNVFLKFHNIVGVNLTDKTFELGLDNHVRQAAAAGVSQMVILRFVIMRIVTFFVICCLF